MACFMLARPLPRMANCLTHGDLNVRIGIGEEYVLVHEDTLALVRRAPKALLAQAREELGLLQSQIEIASPAYAGSGEARASPGSPRKGLAEVDAPALAALYRVLVPMLLRDASHSTAHTPLTRRMIDENRWHAKRFGWQADFIQEEGGTMTLLEVLADLRARCASDIAALDCGREMAGLDGIVAEGTSAHRQLAIHADECGRGAARAAALVPVVRWLIDETVAA